MENELILPENYKQTYDKIVKMIETAKHKVFETANFLRVLRERKKSMLYERTAISKRPEETIRNDIQLLEEKDMMTVDMFYRDPCILDFLGL